MNFIFRPSRVLSPCLDYSNYYFCGRGRQARVMRPARPIFKAKRSFLFESFEPTFESIASEKEVPGGPADVLTIVLVPVNRFQSLFGPD